MQKNGKKISLLNKFLIVILIISLTMANFLVVGENLVSYAADLVLDNQTEATINKNVKFDTYFKLDNGNTHYLVCDVNEQNSNMTLDLKLQNGYLKNAKIELQNPNYILVNIVDTMQKVQEATNGQIILKQINAGENIQIGLTIMQKIGNEMKLEDVSKDSKVVLKGIFVDEKGNEIEIEKEVTVNISWTGNYEAEINSEIIKNIEFMENDQEKVLVQMLVKTGIKETQNKLPIKENNIVVSVPSLNGAKPENIIVLPKNTFGTNGKIENIDLPQENIEKDIENNIVKIKIENKEENGKIWSGNGQDEILLTYIYNKNDMTEESMNIASRINTEITIYNGNETIITKQEKVESFNLAELKGNLISLELTSNVPEINKGKLYANSIVENKQYETEFNTKILVEISYKEKASEIRLADTESYFMDANNNQYALNNLYYKNISISKSNFEKILGQDGEIKILDENGNVITLINNTLEVNQEGNFLVELANQYNRLIIETTKPISEGKLCINTQKLIDEKLEYSKAQIMKFSNLITKMQVEQKENDNYILLENKEIVMPLTETNTNANISLSTDVLSTIVSNEDVEVKIELDNSRENSDFYINGIFKVEFPEYVEDVIVKNYNILYSEGLNIKEVTKQIENDKVVLYIRLEGTQNNFSTGTVTNGTNIILGTDIKTKLLTPTSEDEIKLYYINENAISYKTIDESTGMGFNKTKVSFSAPVGMLAVNKISGYEETGKSIISVNQGTVVDKIKMDSDAKNAKMDLMLINNTGNTCNDVKVLGRIPFEGNKKIGTNEELKTTVNTSMVQGINIESEAANYAKVYYSENGEATEYLNNINNMWVETPEDFSKIKSYMIVFENYELKQGDKLDMSYNFIVPEMIDLNNSLYGTFGATYEKNSEIGIIEEQAVADVVGLTTGTGPVMEINQTVSVGEDGVIQEGQVVKYTFSIKNAGNTDIENLKVKYLIPDYGTYGEYREPEGMGPQETSFIAFETLTDEETGKQYTEFDIGTVPVGETVTKELLIQFGKLPTIAEYYENEEGFYFDEETGKSYILIQNEDGTYTEKELTELPDVIAKSTLKITATDLELKIVESKGNKIEKMTLLVNEKSSKSENVPLKENEKITYTVKIENNSDKKMEDVILEKIIPDGLTYSKMYTEEYDEQTEEDKISIEGTYDSNTRKAQIKIPELEVGEQVEVIIEVITNELGDGIYSKIITTSSIIHAKDVEQYTTAEIKNLVAKPKLVVEQTDDANGEYVSEREKVTFTLTVKNEGEISTDKIKIASIINEYFIPTTINYSINGEEPEIISASSNEIALETKIEPNQTFVMNVTVNATDIPNNLDEVSADNVFTLTGDLIGEITSNKIIKTIEQSPEPNDPGDNDKPTDPDNPGGGDPETPEEVKTYKIKGTAWLDENSNGAREENEKLLSGIKVILLNAKTGDIIVDRTTGKAKEMSTDDKGVYEFDNLIQGEYIVVFYHDSTIYGLTEYAKTGVDSTINSDVILTKITDNGEEKTAAVTNTIVIDTKSISNIDMGLVTNKKADLKLDKYVSTITVQNKDGVKTYNYSETTLAKIEISQKRISGSVVVVEYIMTVTNEGNIPMYAKNIVDYMPTDMKFNSDLNSNWYAGNDGNLYCTELNNIAINPDESKNVKLILTKTMTDNNVGISNNRAEIYEHYNDLGLSDIDSVPGNQAQGEDDLGSANVLITPRTGAGITYTCTILVALVILVTGIYFIRKKTSRYYN